MLNLSHLLSSGVLRDALLLSFPPVPNSQTSLPSSSYFLDFPFDCLLHHFQHLQLEGAGEDQSIVSCLNWKSRVFSGLHDLCSLISLLSSPATLPLAHSHAAPVSSFLFLTMSDTSHIRTFILSLPSSENFLSPGICLANSLAFFIPLPKCHPLNGNSSVQLPTIHYHPPLNSLASQRLKDQPQLFVYYGRGRAM